MSTTQHVVEALPDDVQEQVKLAYAKISILNEQILTSERRNQALERQNAELSVENDAHTKKNEEILRKQELLTAKLTETEDKTVKALGELAATLSETEQSIAEANEAKRQFIDVEEKRSRAILTMQEIETKTKSSKEELAKQVELFEERKKRVTELLQTI